MVRPVRSHGHLVLVGLVGLLMVGVDLAGAHEALVTPMHPLPAERTEPSEADPARIAWATLTGTDPASNVLLGTATPWRPLAQDNGHNAAIYFECPDTSASTTPDNYARAQGDFVVPSCPIRIVDVPNPLGSPWLDVQPTDPTRIAFFSLHGQPLPDGPTERSRRTDTHTTFTSVQSGGAWTDQPIANDVPDAGSVSGEFATGAFDGAGNVYVGYLWNRIDQSRDATGSILWLAKAPPMDQEASVLGHERNVDEAYIHTLEYELEAIVRELHLVRVPPADDGSTKVDDENMRFEILNGTRPRSPFRPEYASGELAVDERIVATWGVRGDNASNESHGMADYVDIAWSLSVQNDTWAHLLPEERIGPCTETGRPAAYAGHLYVPCVVGPGYEARQGARVGDIDVWRFDPWTGKTEQVGYTGLNGGDPLLVANARGYMVTVTSDFDAEENEPEVYYAFGWYGVAWSAASANIAKYFHRAGANGIAHDARVTAAVLGSNENTLLLIYHERQEVDPPEPNPFNPQSPPRPREYTKTVFSMNECDGILAASMIPLGDGLMSFHWDAYRQAPGTFNDVQDGLVVWRDNLTGQEYAYFAVNDYGSIQYGRIPLDNASQMCPLIPPVILGIGTGYPQALQLASSAGMAAGAGIGVLSAAMIAYLLTVKRRTAHYTTADDE